MKLYPKRRSAPQKDSSIDTMLESFDFRGFQGFRRLLDGLISHDRHRRTFYEAEKSLHVHRNTCFQF